MATYPVKWITNQMRGAPVVRGVPGSLISALDAFLIDGWGAITPTSMTVSAGIATVAVNAGQSFLQHAIVLVSGATPAPLNGEQRVLTSTNTSFTFATTAPDGTASGTISIKYAPVGWWEKAYTDTNKAVYRSTHPLASGACLRVNDTFGEKAAVCGFASMTDVDTGTSLFNWGQHDKDSINSRWQKTRDGFTSGAINYAMAADHAAMLNMFDWATAWDATWKAARIWGFGDAVALTPAGDLDAVFLNSSNMQETSQGSFGYPQTAPTRGGLKLLAPFGGGGPISAYPIPLIGTTNGNSGADATMGSAPLSSGVGLMVSRIGLFANSSRGELRALVPGVGHIPMSGVSALIGHWNIVSGAGEWTGHQLMAIQGSAESFSPQNMYTLVDIIGPWR